MEKLENLAFQEIITYIAFYDFFEKCKTGTVHILLANSSPLKYDGNSKVAKKMVKFPSTY